MRVARLLASVVLLVALAPPAAAATGYERVVDITFPVAGPSHYIDDYHQNRSGGRKHQATDIMAARGQRVHASVGGTITWITGLNGPPPSYGYMITIQGDDGLGYNYIHLGTQNGPPSEAYAPGLARGSRVQRGQWIGYVGCSGNASCSAPHLHFEIVDPDLNDPRIASAPYRPDRINPYNSLKAAQARGDVPGATRPSAAIPLTGDWNGDGRATPGWFRGGRVYLRNSNSAGPADIAFNYGRRGDVPVVGDWNGNGVDTLGVRRGSTWYLTNRHAAGAPAATFNYGRRDDLPVTGDWNGNGQTTVGVLRGSTWYLSNRNAAGAPAATFNYGRGGDVPLAGDWNGNGQSTVGVVRGPTWHLTNRNAAGAPAATFNYGRSADVPVTGDWNRSGQRTPGVVRGATWHLTNRNSAGTPDHNFDYSG